MEEQKTAGPVFIPVFIIEEHHEAFFIWNYALQKGLLKNEPHTLLHVDDHADMGLPCLDRSMKCLGGKCLEGDLSALLSFTRDTLGIGDFILPAVYLGLFHKVYWLRRGHKFLETEKTLHLFTRNGNGQDLSMTDNIHFAGPFNPDRKHALFRQIDPGDKVSFENPVILDIDLDYFLCDHTGGGSWEIEITEEEYDRLSHDTYHRLKITSGGRLRTRRDHGRFYAEYRHGLLRDDEEIPQDTLRRRIEGFLDWLKDHHVTPALIDICRSRHSGYTPSSYWHWIEETLLAGLAELFPVSVSSFDRLLREENLVR